MAVRADVPGRRGMSAPRTCYGCSGSGRRGVFECAVCQGRGKLDGPPVQAHADSFRHGVLRSVPENKPPTKRAPVISIRRRRRIVRPDPEGES